MRSSDAEFLASSIEIDEASHPRVLHIRKTIKDATASLKTTPRVRVHDLPPGYCHKGHLVRLRATFTKRKAIQCSACLREFTQDVFSCHCYRYYACIDCLANSKTHPKPPNCPSLECSGSCTLQFKPIVTKCLQGNHDIPANDHAWYCSERGCRSIICVTCHMSSLQETHRQTIEIQRNDEITDTLQPAEFDKLRSPSASQSPHSSPSPNPFLTPSRHNISSLLDQQGQATPMSRDRA